jgi:filamentous hemagglutinin family protein
MIKTLFSLFWQTSTISFCSLFVTNFVQAQPISSDGTLPNPTEVNSTATGFEINGGSTRGGNLFHSFKDFSVPIGSEAFFNNAPDVVNILNRVTGGNISSIDGLIRANGSANLFLINPAGIVFGEGARLNIGGSFYGSTANSILFPNGREFSATNLENQPILTVNAPIGLNFRDNPGDIEIRTSNLTVKSGQNLTLLGGDLNLTNSARIFAPGANVELGAVSKNGVINLDDNFRLNFTNKIALADVFLDGNVGINVISDDGGAITINANNVKLSDSFLVAGIGENAGSSDSQAGDIVINASDNISLEQNSFILNEVANNGQGDAGNIQIDTSSLTLNQSSLIGSQTFGQGNSGNVVINAKDTISINSGSSLRSLVRVNGKGDAGNISINTGILTVETIEGTSENRSLIFSNTRGVGNAGNVNINATDSIRFDNSSLLAQVDEGATGNGGNITINTPRLEIKNSASKVTSASGIFSDTKGTGNAGEINITTDDALIVTRRSSIGAGTTSAGDAGDINIVTDLLSLSNFALLATNVRQNARGEAGTIVIDANYINLSEGAIIDASIIDTFRATEFTGGDININANTLELMSGGKIVTNTSNSSGNAGDINLTIADRIRIDGSNTPTLPPELIDFQEQDVELETVTGLLASTRLRATGNGGNINIISSNASIDVANGKAQISVSSQGQGSGGLIRIEAQDLTLDNNGSIFAFTPSGQGGSISLNVDDSIILRNNSTITAQAFNDADGGNLDIDTRFMIAFPSNGNGNDIIANAQRGNGGNINISANSIFNMRENQAIPDNGTNDIDASSKFGLDGNITINTPDVDPFQETPETPKNIVETDTVVAGSCDFIKTGRNVAAETENTFVITGKGGIPPQPTEPFNSDNILINGQFLPVETVESEERVLKEEYAPIMTDQGLIYPARGMIVKENGDVLLTAYPTIPNNQRSIIGSKNCFEDRR